MSRARMERERFSALEHLQAAVATSVSLVRSARLSRCLRGRKGPLENPQGTSPLAYTWRASSGVAPHPATR